MGEPGPAGWERLVFGGRFMDRLEASGRIGELTSECWGGENVKPRIAFAATDGGLAGGLFDLRLMKAPTP